MSSRAFLIALSLPLFVATVGCVSQDTVPTHDDAISSEDRAFLEQKKMEQSLRADLRSHPSRYVIGTTPLTTNSGIINDYCQLVSLTVANTSRFDVRNPRGTATYYGDDGRVVALVPWSAQGEIPTGESRSLPVSANEMSGRCTLVRAEVDAVQVASP